MRLRFLSALVLATVVASPTMAVAPAPVSSAVQNLPSLGDTERDQLSPAAERKLGDEIMQSVRRDKDFLDDAPLLEYLNRFGGKLVAARPEVRGEANYDFFFFAVRDPTLNAFALPGGNIAVHSALLLAAQNESELASVMAHEIGHVAQRHIARMLGQQKQDSMIPLAALALAVLASRASPDASEALLLGGQGLAAQRQLSFSRDAEREADRVGLSIMRDAGFDTSGMVAFFGRLQTATRTDSDAVPAFLRSHPLTTERIADIQARLSGQPVVHHTDSFDFHLIRARVRVLQDASPQGLEDAADVFRSQLQQKGNKLEAAAAQYGLAYVAFRQHQYDEADSLLQEARAAAQQVPAASRTETQGAIFDNLAVDIRIAQNRWDDAVKLADAAHAAHPLSRGLAQQYAEALIDAHRDDDAVRYLRDQAQMYREDAKLQDLLAKAYAAQGKLALQHMALAQSYMLTGSIPAAIDQLGLARKAPDASYYDQAVIDAREREWKDRWRDELKDAKKDRK